MTGEDFSEDFVATFKYVYQRCLFWRDFFGLSDVYILVRSGDTIEGAEIQCLYDHRSKTAEIVVSEDLEEREPEYLDRLAHHEVCEALLGSLGCLAMARNFDEAVLEAETHSIINRLWNIHKQFADTEDTE